MSLARQQMSGAMSSTDGAFARESHRAKSFRTSHARRWSFCVSRAADLMIAGRRPPEEHAYGSYVDRIAPSE